MSLSCTEVTVTELNVSLTVSDSVSGDVEVLVTLRNTYLLNNFTVRKAIKCSITVRVLCKNFS